MGMKETRAKRESIKAVRAELEASGKRSFMRGAFSAADGKKSFLDGPSELREQVPQKLVEPRNPQRQQHTFEFGIRKRIRKDEAKGLLQDLHGAYCDSHFQEQVYKLAQ